MDKKIKMYALSTCIYCQNAKAWFADKNIEYDCVDVDLLEEGKKFSVLKEIKEKVGMVSFPTIFIGDTVIKGYKPERYKEALGL
ncbi:glutaredoxin family protein [bacterium]|nr:glutaredoxin family protein [bacterium]MBU1874920.1 glutaredoxin family protein [bacterium]